MTKNVEVEHENWNSRFLHITGAQAHAATCTVVGTFIKVGSGEISVRYMLF
jgi:hypothetical protein